MRFHPVILSLAVALTAAVFAPAVQAVITSASSTDVPKSIPDNLPSGDVSILEFPDFNGYVASIRFNCSITHPSRGEISAVLTSPLGDKFTVVSGPNLADNAPNISVVSFLLPNSTSLNAIGKWSLTVADHLAGNTGTLDSWSLDVDVSSSPVEPEGTFLARYIAPLRTATFPAGVKQPLNIGFFEEKGRYAGVASFTRQGRGKVGPLRSLIASTADGEGLEILFSRAGYPEQVYAPEKVSLRIFRISRGRARVVGTGTQYNINKIVPGYLALYNPARAHFNRSMGMLRRTDYRFTDRTRIPTALALGGVGRVGAATAEVVRTALKLAEGPHPGNTIAEPVTLFTFVEETANISLFTKYTNHCRPFNQSGDHLNGAVAQAAVNVISRKPRLGNNSADVWFRQRGRVAFTILKGLTRPVWYPNPYFGVLPDNIRTVGTEAFTWPPAVIVWLQPFGRSSVSYFSHGGIGGPQPPTFRIFDYSGKQVFAIGPHSGGLNVPLAPSRGYLVKKNDGAEYAPGMHRIMPTP